MRKQCSKVDLTGKIIGVLIISDLFHLCFLVHSANSHVQVETWRDSEVTSLK